MNHKKLAIFVAAAALPFAGMLFASALGPNLVKNGDFASGVANWNNFGGNPAAVNGAMQLTNTYSGYGNSYYGAEQCITGIQPGQEFVATAEVFIAGNQPERGTGGLYLHFRDDANCNGNNLPGSSVTGGFDPATRDKWVTISAKATAPAGTKAVIVVASAVKEPVIYNDGVPAPLTVQFDNITLKNDFILVKPTATPTQKANPSPTAQPTAQPTAIPTSTPVTPPVTDSDADANSGSSSPNDTGWTTEPQGQPPADETANPGDTTNGSGHNDSGAVDTGNSGTEQPLPPATGQGDAEPQGGSDLSLMVAAAAAAVGAGGLTLAAVAKRRRRAA